MKTLGRPRQFDREAALEAAMQVFWRKGFVATSMNDLCEAMGIRSPSLYAAFGSKENLYHEAVRLYSDVARARIWCHIDDGPTVKAGMQKMLNAAAKVLPADMAKPSGCMVTMAYDDEYSGDVVADVTRTARADSLAMLRSGLERAVATGELPRSSSPERLARFYMVVVQGMAVQARDGATQKELKAVADVAMAAWPAG